MIFQHDLYPKQEECAEHLYNDSSKYICYGGSAGGGKSWLGCEWIMAMCKAFPGTRYFIARKEKARLKESTLKTLFKVFKKHDLQKEIDFHYNDQKGVVTFDNESEILLLDVKKQPSDPEFEDLGSLEFTGGFGEEVSEWDFGAFDALRTRIGRQLNDKYNIPIKFLLTCNPKKNWVYKTFYKPWKEGELEEGYVFIPALVTDNPSLKDTEYHQTLREIKSKSKRERLLKGNWDYDDDPSQLCDYDSISNVFTNTFVDTGKKYITADVARFGKDKTIIRVWEGLRSIRRLSLDKSSVPDVIKEINKLKNEFRVPTTNIIADEDGVGGGVVDGLRCKGFVNNSAPLKIKDNSNYDNLKSQCAWKLATLINDGLIYDSEEDQEIQDKIIEELEQLKEKDIDNDKKNAMIPKKVMIDNIGRSPDDLDTYIMRAFFELKPTSAPRIYRRDTMRGRR